VLAIGRIRVSIASHFSARLINPLVHHPLYSP
jgi:hypothetical protein